MPADPVPATVLDYVVRQIARLPDSARLVVLFDPRGDLALGDILEVEERDQSWRVTRYDGNDLAFRRNYPRDGRNVVWVTCPPGMETDAPGHIELQSLADVWSRADAFIDASLPGVLQQLVPKEVWPAAPVWSYADILGKNLPAVIAGLRDVRRNLDRRTPLDAHAVRALALYCLCVEGGTPASLPAHVLLFRQPTPGEVLDTYVQLLWQVSWSERGLALLQTQAQSAPRLELGSTMPWYQIPPSALAVYLYVRRLAGLYGMSAAASRLRGLGLLDLDPGLLELWVDSVLARWHHDVAWRERIVCSAEQELGWDDLGRIVELLDLRTAEAAFEAWLRADTPALVYALGAHFVRLALSEHQLDLYVRRWCECRPTRLTDMPQTPYTANAKALVQLFDELAILVQRCEQPLPASPNLAQLLDWYIENGLYDLEYAYTRASGLVLSLGDAELRTACYRYLQSLRPSILRRVNQLDRTLAQLIIADWRGYLQSPRLSVNVLPDAVRKQRLIPTSDACLWIIVFDGMRWDTWERHVKPRLLEKYEIIGRVKPYLCLLPSQTEMARRGLLAGKLPAGWKGYDERLTRDQEQLFARLMLLPQTNWRRLLRFYSGMESDRQYNQIDPSERYPYNVLIYNLSDDNLHSMRGNLEDLNNVVNQLLTNILRVLDTLVQPNDTLIVTSDHGFVELGEANAVVIPDKDAWQRQREGMAHPVHYRYVLGDIPLPGYTETVYRVHYPGHPDIYTVAVGNVWFKRAGWRGATDRYAHGGISFGEMAVPAAILRPIAERRAAAVLDVVPRSLEIVEGESAPIEIRVTNSGSVELATRLEVSTDTTPSPSVHSARLMPGDTDQYVYRVEAVYRQRGDKTVVSTRKVSIRLTCTDTSGQTRVQTKRVPVSVRPRTDIVEIDFGNLDDLLV